MVISEGEAWTISAAGLADRGINPYSARTESVVTLARRATCLLPAKIGRDRMPLAQLDDLLNRAHDRDCAVVSVNDLRTQRAAGAVHNTTAASEPHPSLANPTHSLVLRARHRRPRPATSRLARGS